MWRLVNTVAKLVCFNSMSPLAPPFRPVPSLATGRPQCQASAMLACARWAADPAGRSTRRQMGWGWKWKTVDRAALMLVGSSHKLLPHTEPKNTLLSDLVPQLQLGRGRKSNPPPPHQASWCHSSLASKKIHFPSIHSHTTRGQFLLLSSTGEAVTRSMVHIYQLRISTPEPVSDQS